LGPKKVKYSISKYKTMLNIKMNYYLQVLFTDFSEITKNNLKTLQNKDLIIKTATLHCIEQAHALSG